VCCNGDINLTVTFKTFADKRVHYKSMLGERTLDIGLPKNMELGVREALDG
jgi:hypothetical protein